MQTLKNIAITVGVIIGVILAIAMLPVLAGIAIAGAFLLFLYTLGLFIFSELQSETDKDENE